jgi:ring-1,2-phenylacetyl-CoA epoxidase subunit PaaD
MVALQTTTQSNEQAVWDVLHTVLDPELPAVSIVELGIVRGVEITPDAVLVTITPTYSGCPAMEAIQKDIEIALKNAHFAPQVLTVLTPAWTSDWIAPSARAKLKSIGIAPPAHLSNKIGVRVNSSAGILCPLCESASIEKLSEFGSTACKALYRCLACREPFDYFKPI